MAEQNEYAGYIGVKDGVPIFRKCADESGDARNLSVFKVADDATARYFNVRRVRIIVEPEPIHPPQDWGAIDG